MDVVESAIATRPVIVRVWRGETKAEDSDRYLAYLSETGLRDVPESAGNVGAFILRRIDGGTAEFLFVSLWDSSEAVEGFAGPEVDGAVYYPEDKRYLTRMEPLVRHYEVVGQAIGPSA